MPSPRFITSRMATSVPLVSAAMRTAVRVEPERRGGLSAMGGGSLLEIVPRDPRTGRTARAQGTQGLGRFSLPSLALLAPLRSPASLVTGRRGGRRRRRRRLRRGDGGELLQVRLEGDLDA